MNHRASNSHLNSVFGNPIGYCDKSFTQPRESVNKPAFWRFPSRALLLGLIAFLSFLGISGCGGGSTGVTTPIISVTLGQLPPASLSPGGTATLSATVTNDAANAGVDWAVSCGSAGACGSVSPTHTTSGGTTTFTAPANVPAGNTVNITAFSTTDHSKAATATVSIVTPISIAITQAPPTTMPVNTTTGIVATVTGDAANAGVDWTVTCGSASACGSFAPTHTASGATTTFTAPTAVPTGSTVTIIATSTTDHTKTATAIVTITAAAGISVTFSQAPPASLAVNATASVVAMVANDSANAGVDWTVTCGSAGACGSFSLTHTASGAATTFTAPATVPTGTSVTITATSTTDHTKTATATVTITAAAGISVTFSQAPPATLTVNGTASITATVSNDNANAGVDWTVSCGSAGACGSFSPTHTASGTTTTFTAPAAVPTGSSVTITATSTTDHTKTATASVTITGAAAISVTLTQAPPTSLAVNATAAITATVANDSANAGVDWTVSCSSAGACGSFSPTHTASGTATTFTAPAAVPTGNSVTITATSTTDNTKTATATVTITAGGGISVTFSQAPPHSLKISTTVNIVASVANDSGNKGIDWTVSCGSAGACGSVSPTHTASGGTTVFTSPAAIPTGNTVTITATSTADTTKSVSATITIVTAPISISLSAPNTASGTPPTAMVVNSMVLLVGTVSNDSANAGVDWTVSCNPTGACGTISPLHSGNGAPVAYVAPAAPPSGSGGTVTITAASTTDNTQTASAVITIGPITANGLLDGQFTFLVIGRNGEFNASYYAMAGSFAGDGNGNIVSGEAEVADSNNGKGTSLTGTYTMGSDGRGQITLNTTGLSTFGVSGTVIFSVAFVSQNHALLSETDASGAATGALFAQNLVDVATASSATGLPLNGTYTLTLTGSHYDDPTKRFFLSGALATSSAGSSAPGQFTETGFVGDQFDGGTLTTDSTSTTQPTSGTGADGFGKVEFGGLDVGGLFGAAPLSVRAFIIDAQHYVLAQDQNFHYNLGGYLAAQPSSPTISGTYAFAETGVTASASPQVAGGIFTCGSTGTLDVTPLAGTAIANQSMNVTCTAPASGRGLITLSGTTGGISQFAAYPTTDQGIQLIEIDSGGPAGAGVALTQTLSAPIAASALTGKYASSFLANDAQGIEGFAGQTVSDGTSVLSGTLDVNLFNGTVNPAVATPSSNVSLTGSYTASNNGRFPLTLNIATSTPQTIKPACYIIDANTCLLLGLDTATPGVGILQLQNLGF